MTFDGPVTVGGNVTITNAGSVNFDSGLTITGNLNIAQAGSVTFQGNVDVGGSITVGNSSDYSKVSSVVFTSAARLDYGGTANFYASQGLTFGGAVGLAAPPLPPARSTSARTARSSSAAAPRCCWEPPR